MSTQRDFGPQKKSENAVRFVLQESSRSCCEQSQDDPQEGICDVSLSFSLILIIIIIIMRNHEENISRLKISIAAARSDLNQVAGLLLWRHGLDANFLGEQVNLANIVNFLREQV